MNCNIKIFLINLNFSLTFYFLFKYFYRSLKKQQLRIRKIIPQNKNSKPTQQKQNLENRKDKTLPKKKIQHLQQQQKRN